MDTHITLPINAVGHKLTKRVPIVNSEAKISEVEKLINDDINVFDTIDYIYVVSHKNHLHGVISLKEIFRSKASQKVSDVMKKNLVIAHMHTDRKRVAHLAIKNGIKAVPIIDQENVFQGVFSSDSLLETISHESRLDLLKLAGIIQGHGKLESSEIGIFHSFKYRAPWILIGLFGGLVTAEVIGLFDNVLEEKIILASFIPLVAYVANAVGAQTQTLYVREIAIDSKINFFKYTLKQLLISTLIGLTSWGAIIAVSLALWGNIVLGVFVGLAIFLAIVIATLFALVIPFALERFSIDPAEGGGPFATIIQDLVSVLIYLLIASVAINYL